jgi:AraC-like DNA-binding protein
MHISTDMVPVGQKAEFWIDLVCAHLVEVDCASVVDPDSFHGQIAKFDLPEIEVAQIQATGQVVRRTPRILSRSNKDILLVNIQRRGHSRIRQSEREALLEEGDLAIYSSECPYELAFESGFSQTVLMFPRQSVPIPSNFMNGGTAVTVPRSNSSARLLTHLADAACNSDTSNPRLQRAIQETLFQSILSVARGIVGDDVVREDLPRHHLARARQYALDNLHDHQLDAARIAAAIGISRAHLHRLMRDETQTIIQWVWEKRLLRCQAQLRAIENRHRCIAEIAFQNGFIDTSHFSRAYRRRFGCSPTETRLGT